MDLFIRPKRVVAALTATCAVVSGCAVAPKVDYVQYSASVIKPDETGATKFKFNSSLIVVDQKVDDKTNKVSYTVTSTAVEDSTSNAPSSYGIVPNDDFGIKSNLIASTRPGTQLLDSVGTSLEDNRVQIIQNAATLASSLIGLGLLSASPVAPKATYPASIDVSKLHLTGANREAVTFKGGVLTGAVTYDINYGPVPPDALERTTFDGRANTKATALYYSACRTATITVHIDANTDQVASLAVADPYYLQTAAFPLKGKITMNTSCGVAISSESVKTSSDLDIANALVSAAKTIKDAHANKTKSTSGTKQ